MNHNIPKKYVIMGLLVLLVLILSYYLANTDYYQKYCGLLCKSSTNF